MSQADGICDRADHSIGTASYVLWLRCARGLRMLLFWLLLLRLLLLWLLLLRLLLL